GFQTDVRPTPNQAPGSDKRFSDGLPPLPLPPAPVLTPALDRLQSVTAMSPDLRTGYTLHSSFTIQREIFRNTIIEAGYVRTRGIKLYMQNNLNQSRIYEDFLGAFKQLQAYNANKTPVPAGNTLVRIFGNPDAAVTAVGASNLTGGLVGSAANSLDQVPNTYN